MKIAFIFGTRPEILKVAPIIKEAEKRNIENIIIHTNQHYSYEMDEIFFEELDLRNPDYNLKVGSANHNQQTARMLIELDKVLTQEMPDYVIVQGDTNSTLSGALAASKMGIKVAHVEAGLRSYDREMPEEINRIITDSISDRLFPVTKIQESILLAEGISAEKVQITGNTIVDTLKDRADTARENKGILQKLGLEAGNYFLVTMHRPSNVDNTETLVKMMENLAKLGRVEDKSLVWPIHPRTKSKISNEKINVPTEIKICDPLGYIDFLSLIINSELILTDSGGIQEEACILHKPCLTLRENTERPETVDVGANLIVGASYDKMLDGLRHFKARSLDWKNPFGDGTASAKILDSLK